MVRLTPLFWTPFSPNPTLAVPNQNLLGKGYRATLPYNPHGAAVVGSGVLAEHSNTPHLLLLNIYIDFIEKKHSFVNPIAIAACH